MNIIQFPKEIIGQILDYVSFYDYMIARRVCGLFYLATSSLGKKRDECISYIPDVLEGNPMSFVQIISNNEEDQRDILLTIIKILLMVKNIDNYTISRCIGRLYAYFYKYGPIYPYSSDRKSCKLRDKISREVITNYALKIDKGKLYSTCNSSLYYYHDEIYGDLRYCIANGKYDVFKTIIMLILRDFEFSHHPRLKLNEYKILAKEFRNFSDANEKIYQYIRKLLRKSMEILYKLYHRW